jgi:hypothetical protein
VLPRPNSRRPCIVSWTTDAAGLLFFTEYLVSSNTCAGVWRKQAVTSKVCSPVFSEQPVRRGPTRCLVLCAAHPRTRCSPSIDRKIREDMSWSTLMRTERAANQAAHARASAHDAEDSAARTGKAGSSREILATGSLPATIGKMLGIQERSGRWTQTSG